MLFLVATPIGNLGDLSFRAVETLRSCTYILCEDTRTSRILLNHYNIEVPLKSFHKFNEARKEQSIIDDLLLGHDIAVISDAGTPGISDPGMFLIQKCIQLNINITSIPGPCAAINALICSGLDTQIFQFLGFFPPKEKERQKMIQLIAHYPGTSILYEAPHRIHETLKIFSSFFPKRKAVIGREMTKKFETFYRGTLIELLESTSKLNLKGEIVFLIEGAENEHDWEQLSPEEHVFQLMNQYHISKKEAIKAVAELRNLSKKELYKKVIPSD